MLTELKKLTCICCGGELTEKDGKLVCKYCKSTFEEVEKISEEEVIALNRATTDRNLLRFDEALEEYTLLLKKYPQNEMANWGAFLCDYGIIYEQDYDNQYIPTCHRLNERPVLESPNYINLSSAHKTQAAEIENLRLSIMEKAEKIQPYDVFVCYKATEEKRGVSVPTREASWARDIYELLTKKGLRVFFAEKSLAGSNVDYEPHIYSALRSSKLMFVLVGSIEHVNSTWVANEWKRYAKYVRDGEEKTLRVIYDFINPYDLPKALQNKQAIDHNDMGWVEAVNKAADDIFEIKQETPEWQKAMEEMQSRMNAENGVTVADKYCAKCFAPNVKSAKFCGECGNKEFIVAPDGVKYCIECGESTPIKQKFCLSCGKNRFVYTKEDYQKEAERRERERAAAAERKERERLAAQERARQQAERMERIKIEQEERLEMERLAAERAKKKKKIISIVAPILAAIILVSVSVLVLVNNKARSGLTLELSLDKSYYIVTDCPEDKTEIVIPTKYWGKPVKEIGEGAFANCSKLRDVVISESITGIEKYAFMHCYSLTNITIPDSVTSIGYDSFYNCNELSSVYISDVAAWCNVSFGNANANPMYYAENLYLNNELVTDLTIPDGVTSISDMAFYGCDGLKSVTIGNGVTKIGAAAFYGNYRLWNITFNGTMAEWEKVQKGTSWQLAATKVVCTDGTVSI